MTPPHPAQPFNINIFPNVIQCPPEFFKLKRHKCRFCDYRTDLLWVKKRHEKYVHKAGLHYFVSKKHTFTLKTLAGLKINEHLNQKWQLQSLVEQHFLPKQLADFLLNLHKIY